MAFKGEIMQVSTLIWVVTISLIVGLILIDLFTSSRTAHDVSFKEAVAWTAFYVGVSVAFGLWVWSYFGSTFGTEFFAAYLVEYSLSIDNLFIFVIILAQFAVPSIFHQRILLIGVMLALIFRAVFIAIGAAAIASFSFTFVIFGAIVSELLAVTLAGAGLGYLARRALGAGIWVYLVTIPVFFVIGMIRIYRMSRKEIQ